MHSLDHHTCGTYSRSTVVDGLVTLCLVFTKLLCAQWQILGKASEAVMSWPSFLELSKILLSKMPFVVLFYGRLKRPFSLSHSRELKVLSKCLVC